MVFAAGLLISVAGVGTAGARTVESTDSASVVRFHTLNIEGVEIFYREAGPPAAPVVLLLHGFPSSSFMFRNLIPRLAERYHVVAPGVRDPSGISPDTWTLDIASLNRPGNRDVQLDHFLDYRTNPPLYPRWQEYFRKYQPPMLVVWGKNDAAFTTRGATAYARDLKDVEIHLLDTGHFALEDHGDQIAALMLRFLEAHVENHRR